MRTEIQVLQQSFAEVLTEIPDDVARIESAMSSAEIAHSEQNILQWMQYLPTDCVETMIRMGWDLTT